MKNANKVLACVDQSRFADHVADHAAWAARRLDAPLEFLHIIDRHPERSSGEDHSGAIGIDAQENLLSRLSAEDETRSKKAREDGRLFLNDLRERALAAGAGQVDVRLRRGELEETVVEQAKGVRLLVLGRRGASAETAQRELGRNVERVVRALNRPILAVTEGFKEPQRAMIVFDGGAVSRRGVEMVAHSPLFRGMSISLLMSGKESHGAARQLEWARGTLAGAGFEATAALVPDDARELITQAVRESSVDMLVMSAFRRSPLHGLLFGSRTTELLRAARIPMLLLR